jgi:S-adenosylmethionine hydrolase
VPHPLGLITLLTDFGEKDWFVASVKGVILSINPQATVVDLSHRIPPHAVEDGAYVLKSCYRCFPAGTVHVAVVDPGVGSSRRPLLAKTSQYYFVGPDNGILSYVVEENEGIEVRHIENKQYTLESPGRTFDGRDLFGPAAAWLTKQQPVSSFGRIVTDYMKFEVRSPRWEQQAMVGEIVHVDQYGNLITNFTSAHLDELRAVTKRPNASIHVAGHVIDGLVGSYQEGSDERLCGLINSSGMLELFLKEASAALGLRVGRRDSVRLS